MNTLDGVMVIGLTGKTGAGKSTVSKVFVQNGFRLIDADAISRHVVARGSHCLADLQECFTDRILTPDGELDRQVMASIAFSDHHKLEMLNTIMYPYIMGEILRMIHRFLWWQNQNCECSGSWNEIISPWRRRSSVWKCS